MTTDTEDIEGTPLTFDGSKMEQTFHIVHVEWECPKCGYVDRTMGDQPPLSIAVGHDEEIHPCLVCLARLLRKHGVGELERIQETSEEA